jgi:hypothetical protein
VSVLHPSNSATSCTEKAIGVAWVALETMQSSPVRGIRVQSI